MSVSVSVNGSSYTIPQNRETGWGTNVTSWIVAVSSSTLQKSGGSFTLTGEVDFGASFGLKASYVKSRATNPSSAGVFRLGNTETVSWRNAANSADLALTVSSGNALTFNGNVIPSGGASLTASRVVVTDGSGLLTTEANLAKAKGGTGYDLTTQPIELPEIATPSTPASGFGRVYFKTDGQLYQLNDGGVETQVGSGSGNINYVLNGTFDVGVVGWATYADAAGVAPVNGTGGSPTVTFTQTTSSPLAGAGSGLFTKDAANRQGEGVSYDFTISSADQGKMLHVQFDYAVASGTYADGGMRVYLYDITNSVVIEPVPVTILNSSNAQTWTGEFQTAINSTSYRLIWHVASTSASAYTLKFDRVIVAPNTYSYGAVVTDPVAYTPTFTGFGTVSGVNVQSYRVGGELIISGNFTAGTTTATEARISLGYNGTSGNVTTLSTLATTTQVGRAVRNATTNANNDFAMLIEASVTYLTMGAINVSGLNALTKQVANNIISTGDIVSFFARVPIAGWSSNVVVSDQTDTRVIQAKVFRSSTAQTITTGASVKCQFNGVVSDSNAAYDSATNYRYTIPVAGVYEFKGGISFASTASLGSAALILYKNGGEFNSVQFTKESASFSTIGVTFSFDDPTAKAGDYYEIYVSNQMSASIDLLSNASIGGGSYWIINRMCGPSQIAASEKVVARYKATTAYVTTGIIDYDSRQIDTHNAVTAGASWKFTAPRAGYYSISATSLLSAAVGDSLSIFVNGTGVVGLCSTNSTDTRGGNQVVSLVAGDVVNIRPFSSTSITLNAFGTGQFNQVSIQSI